MKPKHCDEYAQKPARMDKWKKNGAIFGTKYTTVHSKYAATEPRISAAYGCPDVG
jgi:hypothetical protein